ncbi:hypothetical protein N7463_001447 [Penicillium fimorum]|uniref:Uncharacterized protein n=1 Tax=Penicillium fimorum TaxID=1882269 RepID=A0A9X0CC31_9EURO|nr:hypothetical protein N7463_001447 [Penicillium fimorum]
MCHPLTVAPADTGSGAESSPSEFGSLIPTLVGSSNWLQWRNHFKTILCEVSLIHWLSSKSRYYLLHTLNSETARQIAGIAHAKDIWSALNKLYYDDRATENFCYQWRQWTSLRYLGTGSVDKQRFLKDFKCALQDLRELNVEIPIAMVLAQLVCAAEENLDCEYFIELVNDRPSMHGDMDCFYSPFFESRSD